MMHSKQLCNGSAMTGDEEQAAFRKLRDLESSKSKDAGAVRNKICLANQRLVAKLARRFENEHISADELFGEGQIILLRAIARFDHNRGYKFSTYLHRSLRNAFIQAVSKATKHSRRFQSGYDDRDVAGELEGLPEEVPEWLWQVIRMLEPRDQLVLKKSCGVGCAQKSYTEIAKELNLSYQRIKQIKDRAVLRAQRIIKDVLKKELSYG